MKRCLLERGMHLLYKMRSLCARVKCARSTGVRRDRRARHVLKKGRKRTGLEPDRFDGMYLLFLTEAPDSCDICSCDICAVSCGMSAEYCSARVGSIVCD